MFEPVDRARVFAVPLGLDFPAELVRGLQSRIAAMPPEDQARIEIFLSTRRMERRVRSLLAAQRPCLMPRLRLITDLATTPGLSLLPQPRSALEQRLELRQLVRKRLVHQPDLAPLSAAYDLADSLADLMEEMHGEGVHPDQFEQIDPTDHSDHWRYSLEFLNVIAPFFDATARPSAEARQRSVVDALIGQWETAPPTHPVLIAGSTGSRATTARLMRAVANLPQGAVILPGVDHKMSAAVAANLTQDGGAEEHPQFRLAKFAQAAGHSLDALPLWSATPVAHQARVDLVNLALRPAPFTDAWLAEGPALPKLGEATQDLTLIEAQSEREEALAIAVAIRRALEEDKSCALITPDRRLTRRVAAALQNWRIRPDDSGGIPLQHAPFGRLLRQSGDLLGKSPSPEDLLALLKHPLVQRDNRGPHLLQTRDCELSYLRGGPRQITPAGLREWATRSPKLNIDADWIEWVCARLDDLAATQADTLSDWVDMHIAQVEALFGEPALPWTEEEGTTALAILSNLKHASDDAGTIAHGDYLQILNRQLASAELRDPVAAHPGVMIWGTLEARVQGANLVILAGLNEGTWPEVPSPDPWLNRPMRATLGLFSPERSIGLSAHDFQQGLLTPEVILTRAKRDAEAETVPARWLNRLTSLMSGLPDTGRPALAAMQDRGADLLNLARRFDAPLTTVPRAKRPAPQPPVSARPDSLFVTRIETLIRDPYAIYARHVLKLRPLNPLVAEPTAALRGEAIHKVLEHYIRGGHPLTSDALMDVAGDLFDRIVSWPSTRALWMARIAGWAPLFVAQEAARQTEATPQAFEEEGSLDISEMGFTLKGRADRIDITTSGTACVYDYKTGQIPTPKVMENFNKQIPLLALIAAEGGFKDLGPRQVAQAGFIGLGSTPKVQAQPYTEDELTALRDDLIKLLSAYRDRDQGYSARRALHETRWDQDYDHLARYGEWDETFPPDAQKVGP